MCGLCQTCYCTSLCVNVRDPEKALRLAVMVSTHSFSHSHSLILLSSLTLAHSTQIPDWPGTLTVSHHNITRIPLHYHIVTMLIPLHITIPPSLTMKNTSSHLLLHFTILSLSLTIYYHHPTITIYHHHPTITTITIPLSLYTITIPLSLLSPSHYHYYHHPTITTITVLTRELLEERATFVFISYKKREALNRRGLGSKLQSQPLHNNTNMSTHRQTDRQT